MPTLYLIVALVIAVLAVFFALQNSKIDQQPINKCLCPGNAPSNADTTWNYLPYSLRYM